MNNSVIFYSPLGNGLAAEKIGGAECGSLKTAYILRDAGFRIIPLRKPVLRKRIISYLVRIFLTWLKLLRLLIVHRKAVLHVVGVYRELMYVELAFVLSAKVLGHRTVYDIRNGDMIKEYRQRGRLYKRGMLSLLRHSDSVLCQGMDYVRFIEAELGKSSFYYPNFIQDRFLACEYPRRDTRQCRLVYFGRIVPAKNIGLMLEICGALSDRGMSPVLDLIGGCSVEYRRVLELKMEEAGLSGDSVNFWGRKEAEEFFPYLATCHFFLFPSAEPREGHSNSLTEAMGCGVVPVVSDAGFNSQVVDDPALVVSGSSAEAYADVIYRIWTSKEWESYSRRMYLRVRECFAESKIKPTLIDAYDLQ